MGIHCEGRSRRQSDRGRDDIRTDALFINERRPAAVKGEAPARARLNEEGTLPAGIPKVQRAQCHGAIEIDALCAEDINVEVRKASHAIGHCE